MENQHKKISGYRDLTQAEVDAMNQVKQIAKTCGDLITTLEATAGLDQRSVVLAKTNLQQGFMWAVRSIAQPTTFG